MWFALLLLLCQVSFGQAPFWQEKAPVEWSDAQVALLLTESPWAHWITPSGKTLVGPPVAAYLATAGPMVQAEQERDRRLRLRRPKATENDPLAEEYRAWFAENRKTQIVLTVRVGDSLAFSDEGEIRRMEETCVMRMGRKKVKLGGHFPPTAQDPYLRLAFPRSEPAAGDKTLTFDLYLPGVPGPFREAEFMLKALMIGGRPEL